MSNFQTALDATATAYNSAGSAAEENQKVVDSLQGKLASVRASFEQLANTVIDSGLISGVLDLANALLQLLNTPVGAFITQVALMSGALGGLSAVLKYFSPLATQFANFGTVVITTLMGYVSTAKGAQVASVGLAGAIKGVGGASAIAFPLIAVGVAIVWGLVKAVGAAKKAYDEAHPSLEELTADYEEAQAQVDSLSSKLEENNRLIKEANLAGGNESYVKRLKSENAELQRQLDLAKNIANETKQEKGAKAVAELTKFQESDLYKGHNIQEQVDSLLTQAEATGKVDNALAGLIEKIQSYRTELNKEDASQNDLFNSTGELVDRFNALYNIQAKVKEESVLLNNSTDSIAGSVSKVPTSVDSYVKSLEYLNDIQDKATNGVSLGYEEMQTLISTYPELESAIYRTADGWGVEVQALKDVRDQSLQTQKDMVQAEIDKTTNTITQTKARIAAIQSEITAYKSLSAVIAGGKLPTQTGIGGFKDTIDNTIGAATGVTSEELTSAQQQLESAETALTELNALMSKLDEIGTGGVSGGTASKASAKTATDEALTIFQNYYKDINHLRELDEITEEQYYERLQILVDKYTANATANMKKYGTDAKTISRNMYSYIEELANHAAEVQKAAMEKWVSDYETAINYTVKQIQVQIDNLETQRDAAEEYWDAQIDALNEQNDALEDQVALEEALMALEKAKQQKVTVYQDGRFQYVEDPDAVSSAQKDLSDLRRSQKLEADTKALESMKDRSLASIDAQIEGWTNYKESWENLVDEYENQQNKLIANQILGINEEADNLNARLKRMAAFTNQYLAMQAKLSGGTFTPVSISEIPRYSGGSSGGGASSVTGGSVNYSSKPSSVTGTASTGVAGGASTMYTSSGGMQTLDEYLGSIQYAPGLSEEEIANIKKQYTDLYYKKIRDYKSGYLTPGNSNYSPYGGTDASGDYSSLSAYEQYVVSGAYAEAVAQRGTQALNNVLTNMSKYLQQTGWDTGSVEYAKYESVKNALANKSAYASGTTSAFGGLSLVGEQGAEMRVLGKGDGIIPSDVTKNLWSWGMTTPSSMLSALSGIGSSVSNAMQISIGNISLPSVSNASQFVEELKGFKRYAIQYGTGL